MTRAKQERALASASARVAIYGTLLYVAVRFAGTYLDQYAIAAAVVQMVIAEWGSGRLGVAWSDPLAPMPTTSAVALRALRGAGMGLTAAAIVLGVALATGAAHLAPNTPSVMVGLVDLVVPAFLAARDELLLRGLVLRVLPATAPVAWKLGGCALASVAVAWGEGGTSAPILAGAFFGGLAYGALWLRDRGAWLAWGAHAMFLWAAGSLSKGALLDLRATHSAGLASSGSVVAALAVVAAGAVFVSLRRAPAT